MAREVGAVFGDAADSAGVIGSSTGYSGGAIGGSSRKPSQYDVLREFQAKLDDYALGGELPSNLRLSDSAMATILKCITELDEDSLVTAEYIKSFRQKERARAKSRQQ